MLEVKPEVETAVDVATSGDPCCETARDKIFDALKNHEATRARLPIPPNVENYILEASCKDLALLIDRFIRGDNNRTLTLELIEIRNEWIKCDGNE